jgi:hypothetical protein
MIHLGILNIYWFGFVPQPGSAIVQFTHEPGDDERIERVLSALSADVLALIEIVDVPRLERLVKKLPGSWRLRDAAGDAVCSQPPSHAPDGRQRVVFAWNDDTVELVRWGRPLDLGPRKPVVARFRSRASQEEWTAVAIHPKSGAPRGWEGLPPENKDRLAGEARRAFFTSLANWLAAPPPEYAGRSVVLGDFNSVADSSEVAAVRGLPGWRWSQPTFRPPNADRRTTMTDPEIIDHFVLSPNIEFDGHEVLAFDLLPEFPDGVPASPIVWKRTTDHRGVRIRLML